MTVPCMSFTELKEQHLEPNSYTLVNPQPEAFWDEHDRIMVRKGDYTFPLQYKKIYFYPQIVILFQQLDIPVPPDYQHSYNQHMAQRKFKKLTESVEDKETDDADE